MAGDWIPMRLDLRDDQAVLRIAVALGIDTDHAVGLLHRFWSWTSCNSLDGHVDGWSYELIDKLIGIKGFASTLDSVGWLVQRGDGITIPRWQTWMSRSAKQRLAEARKKRRQRRDKCPDDVPIVSRLCPDRVPEMSPEESLKCPDDAGTKKREESFPLYTPPSEKRKELTEIASAISPSTGTDDAASIDVSAQPKRPRGTLLAEKYEEIYREYPRHVGKQAALKAIGRVVSLTAKTPDKRTERAEYLLARVREYAASEYVRTCPPEFIPHPATWFNGGRYEDDRDEWARPHLVPGSAKPVPDPNAAWKAAKALERTSA